MERFGFIHHRRRTTLEPIFRGVQRNGIEVYMYLLEKSGSEAGKEVGVATLTWRSPDAVSGSTSLAPLDPSLHLPCGPEGRTCDWRAESRQRCHRSAFFRLYDAYRNGESSNTLLG